MKRTPLRRTTGLDQSKRLARRSRLSAKSEKKLKSDLALADQMPALFARSNGRCEAKLPGCKGSGQHAHHRRRRSQGGRHELANLVWLCHPCHTWIHAHPEQSFVHGFLVASWDDPAQVPIHGKRLAS